MSSTKYPAATGAVLSAFMAFTSASHASSSRVPDIPQSLYDRYGHTDRSDRAVNTSPKKCETAYRLMRGRVLQQDFADGQGRTMLSVSPKKGGTVKLEIELDTKGLNLPSASCSPF